MTKLLHPSFNLLGLPCKDVVTGIEGIVDSICFDLYGCIQGSLMPEGLNEKGERKQGHWFDVKRLKPFGERVMSIPDFNQPEVGPADKAPR
jgi:hypothetical protein